MITGQEFFELIQYATIYGVIFGFLVGIVIDSVNRIK